jgi:hypothetical protein
MRRREFIALLGGTAAIWQRLGSDLAARGTRAAKVEAKTHQPLAGL